ncbi:MAG: peptidoglycan editing factor PgeF [Bryobacteraceae bacterium]
MSPLRASQLDGIWWADHGFGTRHDGAWTPIERTAKLSQVHGNGVVAVREPGSFGDGDALITATADLWLEIRTADCVPLLVADPVRRVVAAVHAGWRGTAAQIARMTVETLTRDWGCGIQRLRVGIGPCIAACCFEVSDEVAAQFPGHATQTNQRAHVDLVSANRRQLVDAGIPAGQIENLGRCTACDPGQFHSFRRDRGDGRMVSAIRIRHPLNNSLKPTCPPDKICDPGQFQSFRRDKGDGRMVSAIRIRQLRSSTR